MLPHGTRQPLHTRLTSCACLLRICKWTLHTAGKLVERATASSEKQGQEELDEQKPSVPVCVQLFRAWVISDILNCLQAGLEVSFWKLTVFACAALLTGKILCLQRLSVIALSATSRCQHAALAGQMLCDAH